MVEVLMCYVFSYKAKRVSRLNMILLFFSQMAALESAGFESMHGYSEVCILSIKLCRLTISATSI